MNLINYIVIVLVAIVSVILDTSYFSFLEIWHATVLITFQILIVLAIIGFRQHLQFFAAFAILLYAIFSSVPLYFLIVAFLGIPLLVIYLKSKITYESNFPVILLSFLIINMIFQLGLVGATFSISAAAMTSVASFSLINTVVGLVIYYIVNYLKLTFRLEERQ